MLAEPHLGGPSCAWQRLSQLHTHLESVHPLSNTVARGVGSWTFFKLLQRQACSPVEMLAQATGAAAVPCHRGFQVGRRMTAL
jgi:hypothetical protein